MSDADTDEFFVNISGPWGYVNDTNISNLFKCIAEAAPYAMFSGKISGFSGCADIDCKCDLKDNLLYLSYTNGDVGECNDLYAKEFKKKLSRVKFCNIFDVDKEDFDRECYDEFIYSLCDSCLDLCDIDFYTFTDYCDIAEIDEDDFEDALNKIKDLKIPDYYSFREQYEESLTRKEIYNPITKKRN